ncbi:MAG: hypothetical protein M3N13_02920 [Candidatus Eremiobacteraeota bacterium]|nr:hypothetical protein [Candidatus Eremiobacteraeota bacterium]
MIVRYHSQGMDLLYRADNGLAIACRNKLTILDGEDPNPAKINQRNYLDETYALAALRAIADRDVAARLGEDHIASFDERDGESRLVKPSGQILDFKN